MDLREIDGDYVDWGHVAQGRDQWRALVDTVMNLRVPWKAGNFLTRLATISFLSKILLRLATFQTVMVGARF
jgi:hypothetical protein